MPSVGQTVCPNFLSVMGSRVRKLALPGAQQRVILSWGAAYLALLQPSVLGVSVLPLRPKPLSPRCPPGVTTAFPVAVSLRSRPISFPLRIRCSAAGSRPYSAAFSICFLPHLVSPGLMRAASSGPHIRFVSFWEASEAVPFPYRFVSVARQLATVLTVPLSVSVSFPTWFRPAL